jgi:hypothetical protein
LSPGERFHGARRSREGTYELVVHGTTEPASAEIFEIETGTRTARFAADGWLARGGLPIGWIDDDHLLAQWSAGTNVALAVLYDQRGEVLLDLYCDAMDREGPFLACWSPPGAPVGGARTGLRIYDLQSPSLEVEVPLELRDPRAPIQNVLFHHDGVWVLLGEPGSRVSRTVYLPVWGP